MSLSYEQLLHRPPIIMKTDGECVHKIVGDVFFRIISEL